MKVNLNMSLLILVLAASGCATMKIGEYESSEVQADIGRFEKSLKEWKVPESSELLNKYKGIPQCYRQISGIQLTNNTPACKAAKELFVTNLNVVADPSLAKVAFKNGTHPNAVMQNFDENFDPNLISMYVRIPGEYNIPVNKLKNYDLNKYISYGDSLMKSADKKCRIFGAARDKSGKCRNIDNTIRSLSEKRKTLGQILAKLDSVTAKRKAYAQSAEGKKNRNACINDIKRIKPVLTELLGLAEVIKEIAYTGDKVAERKLNRKVDRLTLKVKKRSYQMVKHKCDQFDNLPGKNDIAEFSRKFNEAMAH